MKRIVEDRQEWNLVKTFDNDDIGYQYVIRRNGMVEFGRSKHLIGAQARGWNSHSLAICLVGGLSEDGTSDEFNFTSRQMSSARLLIEQIKTEYEDELEILGHNEVTSAKTCPTFNVPAWYQFGDIILSSGVKRAKESTYNGC